MANKEQEQDLRNKAYELRLAGKTYRQIGMAMGIGHETARRWITQHLAEETLPLVEEVRKTEVDRMLRILDRLEARAEMGDDKAIALQLKVSERLCKMLGADMPTQVEVTKTEVSQMDLAIRDLITSQAAKNQARLEAASSLRPVSDAVSTDSVSTDLSSADGESSIEQIVFDN